MSTTSLTASSSISGNHVERAEYARKYPVYSLFPAYTDFGIAIDLKAWKCTSQARSQPSANIFNLYTM